MNASKTGVFLLQRFLIYIHIDCQLFRPVQRCLCPSALQVWMTCLNLCPLTTQSMQRDVKGNGE